MNAPEKDSRIHFYNMVTTGNLIAAVCACLPLIVWGIRLESRVDFSDVLRARLEKQLEEQITKESRRDDRIEAMLARITEDLTAVRIQLGRPNPGAPK